MIRKSSKQRDMILNYMKQIDGHVTPANAAIKFCSDLDPFNSMFFSSVFNFTFSDQCS